MEPRIQYAKTEDGVSIAFWTLGEGKPLVHMPTPPWGHIQLEWQEPGHRRWYQRLAESRMVVHYDCRGCGLSDRKVGDFNLDSQVLDLAVVDRLGLGRLVLYAPANSTPVAIAYAARHPDKVSHLILMSAYARASDWGRSPKTKALGGLVGRDWQTYTETYASIAQGWSAADEARQTAALLRASISEEAIQAFATDIRRHDVTDLLPRVTSPTLVLQRRDHPIIDMESARGVASAIPDARLVIVEGGTVYGEAGDFVADTIDEFLGERKEAAAPALAKEDVHTILFTDVEASTALTDRLGDAKARDVLRTHEGIVREALRTHGGSEVKTMGDGFMASFSSATKALECAIAVQRAFEEHNETAEEPIKVRVGLNAGEPIAEEEDLFGTAVIRAARIAALAEGGEILVANVVRELSEGKGFLFADRGDTALRGFEDPVRLFEVRWREAAGG
jgi:class 3 adenylate cyclase